MPCVMMDEDFVENPQAVSENAPLVSAEARMSEVRSCAKHSLSVGVCQ